MASHASNITVSSCFQFLQLFIFYTEENRQKAELNRYAEMVVFHFWGNPAQAGSSSIVFWLFKSLKRLASLLSAHSQYLYFVLGWVFNCLKTSTVRFSTDEGIARKFFLKPIGPAAPQLDSGFVHSASPSSLDRQ